MRFLVIDDCYEDRSFVEWMLAKRGHRATLVSSGIEAITVIYTQRFDVALVDLGMPGMTGHEVIRLLKAADPELRVMVLSSFDDKKNILEAMKAGADGYLLKHELNEHLGRALQELIAGQSPLSSVAGAILVKHMRGQQKEEAAAQPVARIPLVKRPVDRVVEIVAEPPTLDEISDALAGTSVHFTMS
jgi:DNA-binding NarL/FixJ family response regulator